MYVSRRAEVCHWRRARGRGCIGMVVHVLVCDGRVLHIDQRGGNSHRTRRVLSLEFWRAAVDVCARARKKSIERAMRQTGGEAAEMA